MADRQIVPILEGAVVATDGIRTHQDRVDAWAKAFDQWLQSRSENTKRAYERAWEDLLAYTDCQPWAIQSIDIRDWIADLQARQLHEPAAEGLIKKGRRKDHYGYSKATINQYLAAVSSFYSFVMEKYLIYDPLGREHPLHNGINPARAVDRFKIQAFGHSEFLNTEQMAAIIHIIPRDTVQGLRDLALLMGYMLTGRRSSEWRTAQWSDFEQRANGVYHRWSGKGKEEQLFELAPPVWEAIINYLESAGRLEDMQDEDYIFTPLTNVATRLPNVSELGWSQNRPLSLGHCNAILKKYARMAEIDPIKITIHSLRHSFAMHLKEQKVDVFEISRRLAHSNTNTTRIYLEHMSGVPDTTWRQSAAVLKLDLLQDT